MKSMRVFIAVLTGAIVLMSTVARAQLTPAYVDWVSGIIVSRGEARTSPSESLETAKARALQDAKDNLVPVLERLNLDTSQTIGDYLSAHPEKRPLLEGFVNSAKIINQGEAKGDAYKITISLPVEGAGGLKLFMDQLKGVAQTTEPQEMTQEESDETSRAISGRAPEDVAKPYRVAIFDFDNAYSYNTPNLGSVYTARLKEMFKNDRRFVFLSPTESQGVLASNGKSIEDLKSAKITDNIPLEGVDGVVLGKIIRYEPETKKRGLGGTGYLEMVVYLTVEMRILDAATGRWVYFDSIPIEMKDRAFTLKSADDAEKFMMMDDVDSQRGLAGRAFEASLQSAEKAVRTSFPLEGYVLKLIGDRAYINLTKLDGLHEGDELNVYRVGEMLTDPVTGKKVGRVKDRVGVLRVTDAGDSYTQTIVKEMLGDTVLPGDIVSLK